MADNENRVNARVVYTLFGRRDIYSSVADLNEDNIVAEVNSALAIHCENMMEEEYLYWYRRGLQPILNKTKEVRPEINATVVENHADEIVAFKNGFFLTQPATYISRDPSAQDKINALNEYLFRSGKHEADNTTIDWFHTVGKGVIFVEPGEDDEVPFRCYAIDPRSAFVVYDLRPGNKPLFAVNTVVDDEIVYADVYTATRYFKLKGTYIGKYTTDKGFTVTVTEVVESGPNVLGKIPIIEYRYNSVNMGSFESVVPLMDAMNQVTSDQMDGLDQFIQSLAIAVNCEFDEGTTANDIRKAGMLVLKSVGENKADFKILSEQLNQSETQVFKNYLYNQMCRICALPSADGRTYDSTGAAVLASQGFYQADAAARNTEDLFKKSNKQFDAIVLDILKRKGLLSGLSLTDFELQFVRNETANAQSKAQAAATMLGMGMAPELAFGKSGISNDPVADVKMSEKWLKLIWGDPDNPVEGGAPVGGQNAPAEVPVGGGRGGAAPEQKSGGGRVKVSGGDQETNHNGEVWIEGYWQKRS